MPIVFVLNDMHESTNRRIRLANASILLHMVVKRDESNTAKEEIV